MTMNTKKMLLSIIIEIIIAYFLAGIILYLFQSNFIYYPSPQDFSDCPGFSDATAQSYNGTRFYEMLQNDKLIVFYHGNAGSACDRAPIKDELKQLGYSLLFVEYTGYSNDNKRPSTALLLKDAERVQQYIHEKNYSSVILIGESVGTCFASYHRRLSSPEKMILISPPTSLIDIARNKLPIYPYGLLLTENCDNIDGLKDYSGKILILHGGRDNIIPSRLISELYLIIPSSEKEIIRINDADHNTLFLFDETWDSLKKYISDGFDVKNRKNIVS